MAKEKKKARGTGARDGAGVSQNSDLHGNLHPPEAAARGVGGQGQGSCLRFLLLRVRDTDGDDSVGQL